MHLKVTACFIGYDVELMLCLSSLTHIKGVNLPLFIGPYNKGNTDSALFVAFLDSPYTEKSVLGEKLCRNRQGVVLHSLKHIENGEKGMKISNG